jgi:nucleotide-binding universal stress UspA family protein
MKVLMATDGSKRATQALSSACRILSAPDRDVDLAIVVPRPGGRNHPHAEKLCRRAARILEATKKALMPERGNPRTMVKTGSPARTLIEMSLDYDVTVVGAASRRNESASGLGPVASRLVEHSDAPVLVAREGAADTGIRILAAVDGSDSSLRALETLAGLVDLSMADVTLVHVVESPWLHREADQEWFGYPDEPQQEIDPQADLHPEFVREAEQLLEEARDRLPAREAVSTLVYEGLPADEIISEAERGDYDLVVMGTSGAGDLKHQILGSVSTKVAWNAPCSVLLVRPGTSA